MFLNKIQGLVLKPPYNLLWAYVYSLHAIGCIGLACDGQPQNIHIKDDGSILDICMYLHPQDFTQNLTAHQFDRLSLSVDAVTQGFETAYDQIVASEVAYSGLDNTIHESLDGLPDKFGEVLALLGQFLATTDEIQSTFELKTEAQLAFTVINDSYVDIYTQAQDSLQVS